MRRLVFLLWIFSSAPLSWAVETPYIDSVKEKLKQEEESEGAQAAETNSEVMDPYIQKLRQAEAEAPSPTEQEGKSFIEKVQADPEFQKKSQSEQAPGSFIENIKNQLEPDNSPGAIAKLHDGNSELELKRPGEIHSAASIRYGALLTRSVTAGSGAGAHTYAEIYGSNYTPSLAFNYEYQPWHSEWWGSLGILGGLGFEYSHGFGILKFALTNPAGGTFSQTSRTVFGLLSVPLSVGLNYRMNVARLIRPFAAASALAIGYMEARSDQSLTSWKRGYSLGYVFSGGVNLMLDWFSRGGAWDLYMNYGIHHTYLTVSYDMLGTFIGDLTYSISGVQAGMTFEF